jgi:beta-galactosidase/beta-glucuronidase|tara:strand:+ start:274 stop:2124 length:1851 start_codon:yes stop_codon:yes gene_type:complete
MKKIIIIIVFFTTFNLHSQWKPAGDNIKTKWADNIDPENVLKEYPRPLLVRKDWKNLNGLWDYSITGKGMSKPKSFDGKILVPFSIESSLSGVQKRISENNELWYYHNFSIPRKWKKKQIILHFGAVDWKSELWINDKKVGIHKGGFDPFSFNITPFLNKGKMQKIELKVWDPTDDGFQPRGKQIKSPRGIWYTPVSGIWQTVWLEPVNKKYISKIHIIPDIDNENISIKAVTSYDSKDDFLEIIINEDGKILSKVKVRYNSEIKVPINNPKLWSPESPFLYELNIKLISKGKVIDVVESYAGMRKISINKDVNGTLRMQLNNKDYFQFGTLDQGWWPDGLYTAPTDEALKFDIIKTKDLGFNMIRKHVKVEPARWYYHADKLGILVWQDMPNGEKINSSEWQSDKFFNGDEFIPSNESAMNFKNEWKEIMDFLYSNPSIVCWVPFNESWGQFQTEEISEWTKAFDPSRLVNAASGGNYYRVGDVTDIHNYPEPKMKFYDPERTNVLGEYGGIGLAIDGHLWQKNKNWGYLRYNNSKDATDQYVNFANQLYKMVRLGFSGAIYTQITDVEGEVNGLMTYDRKIMKLDLKRVREVNLKLTKSLPNEYIRIMPDKDYD